MLRSGLAFLSLIVGLSVVAAWGCSKSPNNKVQYVMNYSPEGHKSLSGEFLENPAANSQLKEGQLPLVFTGADGKTVDLATFRGKSNVVLVVVKGMPQAFSGIFCPGCLAQMYSLSENHESFQKRDAVVLVVFPGPSDKLNEFLTHAKVDGSVGTTKSTIPLLLDQNMTACAALGIDGGDLAKPSTYILDKAGSLVYAYVGEGTTDRPSLKALFAQLDKLNLKK